METFSKTLVPLGSLGSDLKWRLVKRLAPQWCDYTDARHKIKKEEAKTLLREISLSNRPLQDGELPGLTQIALRCISREDVFVKVRFAPGQTGLHHKEHTGVVSEVEADTQAAKYGVKVGWVMHEVDGRPYKKNALRAASECGRRFTVKFKVDEIAADPGDPLRNNRHGVPYICAVLFEMVATLFTLYRRIMRSRVSDTPAGLSDMMKAIFSHAVEPDVREELAMFLHQIVFGDNVKDENNAAEARYTRASISQRILGDLHGPPASLLNCFLSYLQHLGGSPLGRLHASMPRTIAFIDMWMQFALSQEKNGDTRQNGSHKRAVWIVGDVETAVLAQEGYFDDAVCLSEGRMDVHLLSDHPLPGRWPCGKRVQVDNITSADFEKSCKAIQARELSPPLFVFLERNFRRMGMELPGVSQDEQKCLLYMCMFLLERNLTTIICSSRSEHEAKAESALLDVLGAHHVMTPNSTYVPVKYARNPFSQMAGNPDMEYDEHGWWCAVKGSQGSELARMVMEKNPTSDTAYDQFVTEVGKTLEPGYIPDVSSSEHVVAMHGFGEAEASVDDNQPEAEPEAQPERIWMGWDIKEGKGQRPVPVVTQLERDRVLVKGAGSRVEDGEYRHSGDDLLFVKESSDNQPGARIFYDDARKRFVLRVDAHQEDGVRQAFSYSTQTMPPLPPLAKAVSKSPVVFWGILDLKYDPAKARQERVRVLETGDGRTSRFSGYGAAIKEAFEQENKLQGTIQCAALTENKKLTHDTIVEIGYAHVRPTQVAYPMEYYPELADNIIATFNVNQDQILVLKLCNRTRGAGVIPVYASDLDRKLFQLLRPQDIDLFLASQQPDEASTMIWGCYEEQVRHWWSNECPMFLVEDFCQSISTQIDDRAFDGTMRVGFLLHRDVRDHLPPGWSIGHNGRPVKAGGDPEDRDALQELSPSWNDPRPFLDIFRPEATALRIQWLGGYWKLPIEDTFSSDLRGKVVSVAKQGTAPVALCQLHDVYAILGDMVPKLFSAPDLGHAGITKKYSMEPCFAAFVSVRIACQIRFKDKELHHKMLNVAQVNLAKTPEGQPKAVCASYIQRNFAIYEALHSRWENAVSAYEQSLKLMPANATSRYLLGMVRLEQGKTNNAIVQMEEALLLDPDFKAPYANLGLARLRSGEYRKAAEISAAGLIRHPYTAACFYNEGLARFALLCILLENQQREAKIEQPRMATAQTRVATAESWLVQMDDVATGPKRRYKVIHRRVLLRRKPSKAEAVVGVVGRGLEIEATPYDCGGGEAWLLLGEAACRAIGLALTVRQAWLLMDGGYIGLGPLVMPALESQRDEQTTVTVSHPMFKGKPAVLKLHSQARVRDVKVALVTELGHNVDAWTRFKQQPEQDIRLTCKMYGGAFTTEHDDNSFIRNIMPCEFEIKPYGSRFEPDVFLNLFTLGHSLNMTTPQELHATLPGRRRGVAPGSPPKAPSRARVAHVPQAEEERPDDQRRHIKTNDMNSQEAKELRARAVECLENAKKNRFKDQPWTERDAEILEWLRSPGSRRWQKGLPRDGWRLVSWRP